MFKKKCILALGLTMALLATACSSGGPVASTGPSPSSAAGSTDEAWEGLAAAKDLSGTITYMHFGDDYERQMYAEMFENYMKKVPNVKIEQMFVPGDDYYTKLQTLGASKTLPDIFYVAETRVTEFAQAGLLSDLTPYYEKYPKLTEDLVEGVLKYGEFDGKPYGHLKDWTSYVMYLNKDLFAEAGVELPTSDWTMDDYLEIAQKLTKKSGDRVVQYGTAVNNYRADWINFMGNFDAPWFKDGKANISDPLSIKGLSYPSKLIETGAAPSPGSVSSTGDTEDRLFIIGKIAMYPSGRWVVPSFRTECDFEWTAIEMPKGTTRVCPLISALVCIGESSKNKDAAANLLSYQMSDEGLLPIMSKGLALPLYKHLLEDPDYVSLPPEADAFIDSAEYLGDQEQVDILKTGKWAQFNDIMRAELSLAFEGKQSIEQAAANIDAKANADVFK